MSVKLTMIGPVKYSDKAKKNFREVMAEGWGENKSAWDKTCAEFDKFKPGDEVDCTISDNGKYINFVTAKGGQPFTGGKTFSKGGFQKTFTPDPEKNTSVYTSYVLEHCKGQKPEEAVAYVMKVRSLVDAALKGPAPKENLPAV